MHHNARRACILALDESLLFSASRFFNALLSQPPEGLTELRVVRVRVESIDEVPQALNVGHEFIRTPRPEIRQLYIAPLLG
jgi:hypothetical protein